VPQPSSGWKLLLSAQGKPVTAGHTQQAAHCWGCYGHRHSLLGLLRKSRKLCTLHNLVRMQHGSEQQGSECCGVESTIGPKQLFIAPPKIIFHFLARQARDRRERSTLHIAILKSLCSQEKNKNITHYSSANVCTGGFFNKRSLCKCDHQTRYCSATNTHNEMHKEHEWGEGQPGWSRQ
jgi:hypothetical protein